MNNEAHWIKKLQTYRTDPWAFCTDCVYTLDQADEKEPIKKFPSHYQYLKLYTRIWQKERFIVVPKSRRMFMSWMNLALYTWDAMFHAGKFEAFISKKEEDAAELVKKSLFILDHIPEEMLPRELIPKYVHTYAKLEFPEINSEIRGFPQGADQTRQYTVSGFLADEMGFWEQAQETYASSVPTLEGGHTRFTGVSSPAPGFFKRLVFDQLDAGSASVEQSEYNPNRQFPLDGIEVWKNPKNKFFVFQLHYSANAKKRDPKYRETVKSGMPIRQYMQEYELTWESFAGTPVYPDFQRSVHGSKEKIEAVVGLPLMRGWDFGITPACVIGQYVDGVFNIICEFTAMNKGADQFSKEVRNQCNIRFKNHIGKDWWIDYVDPSGFFRKDTDLGTCAQLLIKNGIDPHPGPVSFEERKTSVEYFLTRYTKDGANFRVSLPDCPVLVRGFEGGYRYDEKAVDVEPTKVRPIKDEHSHPQDALQYICWGVRARTRRKVVGIPRPGYSWETPAERNTKEG